MLLLDRIRRDGLASLVGLIPAQREREREMLLRALAH